VTARAQSAGRGRGDNRWHSDAGSLTFTFVFDPTSLGLEPGRVPLVTLAAAMGAIDVLEGRGLLASGSAQIRWPNDLEVGGRKLAGFLPERVGPVVLLGVGLNVTTDLDAAPPEVAAMATSLAREGPGATAEDLLGPLLEGMGRAIEELVARPRAIAERWRGRDGLLGVRVRVRLPERHVDGRGAGIDDEGRLGVERPGGVEWLSGGVVVRGVR
jgi:BirA family biotin operon repressor/biotin-[acetyl-CoA-carboxylase] ligase